MQNCDWSQCKEKWAQYVVTYPDKTKRKFCAEHKDALLREVGINLRDKLKIQFVGSIPDGIDITKS